MDTTTYLNSVKVFMISLGQRYYKGSYKYYKTMSVTSLMKNGSVADIIIVVRSYGYKYYAGTFLKPKLSEKHVS